MIAKSTHQGVRIDIKTQLERHALHSNHKVIVARLDWAFPITLGLDLVYFNPNVFLLALRKALKVNTVNCESNSLSFAIVTNSDDHISFS